MARKVFISVLGFTNYNECIYTKDTFISYPVRFIQEATLCYLLEKKNWTENDAAYILLTEGAEKANWVDNGQKDRTTGEAIACDGLCTRFQNMKLPFEVTPIRHLPHGNSEDEIWHIFEQTFDRLQEGDELYFDLTHGFRYLPMLVMVLINYSKFLKNTTVKSITYGNYESRNAANEAPIIDLLPLSVLQDWTYAAGQFLDSGNVQRLIELSKTKLRPLMIASSGKDKDALLLTKFTNYLGIVIEDMKTCRGLNILKANDLLKLRLYMSELESTFIKPLNPIFNKLKKSFDCYQESDNVQNLFEAAKWCLEKGLYQQAITILQEGIVTYVCQANDLDFLDTNLRTLVSGVINLYGKKESINNWIFPAYYTEEQKEADKALITEIFQSQSVQQYAKIYIACTEFRNDFSHSGMRPNPKPASNIKKGIEKVIDRVFGGSIECSPLYINRNKVLINLSNHPSHTWDKNQKEAALEYGEVLDIPFPMVDANDDTDYIDTLADEYFNRIQAMVYDNEITVHLMGELTFTFALLKRLREVGIRCIASTSKRMVKEEVPGRKEEVIFIFERFREYR